MKIPTSWYPIGFIKGKDCHYSRFWSKLGTIWAYYEMDKTFIWNFYFLEWFLKIKMFFYHTPLRFSFLQILKILNKIHIAYWLISSWLFEAFEPVFVQTTRSSDGWNRNIKNLGSKPRLCNQFFDIYMHKVEKKKLSFFELMSNPICQVLSNLNYSLLVFDILYLFMILKIPRHILDHMLALKTPSINYLVIFDHFRWVFHLCWVHVGPMLNISFSSSWWLTWP